MSPERGGMNEGWGTDFEAEVSEGRAELDMELDEFERSWKTADNAANFSRLMLKWRNSKDTEKVLEEMQKLDSELAEALDDQDINNIIADRAGAKKKAAEAAGEELEDEDEDLPMAA